MNFFIGLMAMMGTMPIMATFGFTADDDKVVVAVADPFHGLDKFGTSGAREKSGALRALGSSGIAKRRSFGAERTGFSDGLSAAISRLQQLPQ